MLNICEHVKIKNTVNTNDIKASKTRFMMKHTYKLAGGVYFTFKLNINDVITAKYLHTNTTVYVCKCSKDLLTAELS